MPANRWTWIWMLSLTALAFSLRWGAGADWWFNPDEALDWSVASSDSLAELHATLLSDTAHPPGFFYLLRGMMFVSDDLAWLRFPSLLAGTLLAPLLFLWCRRLAGPATGVVAGLITALSTAVIEQSDVVRPYSLQVFTLGVGLLALEHFRAQRRAGALVAYASAISAAILLHYSSILVLAPVGALLLWWVWDERLESKSIVAVAVAHAPILLLLAAVFFVHLAPAVIGNRLHENATQDWLSSHYAADAGGALTLLGARLRSAIGFAEPGWLVAGLFCLGVGRAAHQARWGIVLLSSSAVLLACGLALAQLYPLGNLRHSFYLLPFLILPVSYAVGSLIESPRLAARAAGGLLLLAVALFQVVSISRLSAAVSHQGTRERVIRLEAARSVATHLDRLSREGGLLLTDNQTFRVLQPLLKIRRSQVEPVTGAETVQRVSWQGLDFFFPWKWRLVGRRQDARGPNHLASLIEGLSRDGPLEERLRGERVWVIQGGWGPPLLRALPRHDATGREIWSPVGGGKGLMLMRLNTQAYLSYLAGEAPAD